MGDDLKLVDWKARVLSEYLRLSGESRFDAEMFFDHASGIIGNLHKDGVAPSDAAKQLLFDDAQYDNACPLVSRTR
jgi:hypothetical protein